MSDDNHDLPDGWKLVTLGDIAKVVGGGTPKTTVAGNFSDDTGHPWITPADLTGYTEKYISRGRRNLTDQGLATSSAKYMPAGTVLYSTRAPIGYVAIAANPVTTNQGFRSFVPSSDVDPEYLYYGLKLARREAEQLASGTTFAELSGTNAKKLHLPLAPLDVQRQIVHLLDAASTSSSSARQHIAAAARAVERFRQAVLAAACSGRLTADWREDRTETVHELVKALSDARRDRGSRRPVSGIAESDLPDIPESWEWVSVDALATAVVDGVHKTPKYVADGVPFVTVRSLTAGPGIDLTSGKFISPEDHAEFTRRTHPQRGDILISKDGTIGVTRAVRTDEEFSIFVSVAMVKPILYEMTDYLEIALKSPQVQSQMVGVGSGLMHLVLRDLKADGIPLPPLNEQHEIVKRVERLLTLADALEKRIRTASNRVDRSPQAVLAKAFRGELLEFGGTS